MQKCAKCGLFKAMDHFSSRVSQWKRGRVYYRKNCDQCHMEIPTWRNASAFTRIKSTTPRKYWNRIPSWLSKDQAQQVIDLYNKRLSMNVGITDPALKWTIDHIVPFHSPLVSGLHVPWNLQIIRYMDNIHKGQQFDDH